MRRSDRETTEEKAWEIADASSYGTLSLITPEGLPYGVPVTLFRQGHDLYFHCAHEGLKTACLTADPHVSICCVSRSDLNPQAMSVNYSSAIITGTASEVTDPEEKLQALITLCTACGVPRDHPALQSKFPACLPRTAIWKITVSEITGKMRK